MYRFQLLYRNAVVLKRLQCLPLEVRGVSAPILRLITTDRRKSENNLTTNTDSLKELVKEQGDLVRKLKNSGSSEAELKDAISELLRLKQELQNDESESSDDVFPIDHVKFETLMKRRFIYNQSYEIYGGASGFYDLGPIGCALKANLLQLWRRFFVIEDQMLEIDCPAMTIEPVFKVSGHISRFTDYLVKDVVTNEAFRVDHLIKSHLKRLLSQDASFKKTYDEIVNKLDGATQNELRDLIQKFNVKSPDTGNDLSDLTPFNLMFNTQIGTSSLVKGYLRPETSQGIFVNFNQLLSYNQGKLPFAVSQVGNAFRNEISPKSGLLRVREFTMAEIEYFFDPDDKSHSKFEDVKNTKLVLYSADNQEKNEQPLETTIGEAVKKGLIANETLGYFLARIQQFLVHVGISPNYLRFRQHMSNEMAHYAVDCWDAECLTSHGWIECVGCADRSAYDLKQHSKASGINLVAQRTLQTPKEVTSTEIKPSKECSKRLSSKKLKQLTKFLADLSKEEKLALLNTLNEGGSYEVNLDDSKTISLQKSLIHVKEVSKLIQIEDITPNVIEPSFGIGRILYAILEHSYRVREVDSSSYLALPASITPHKCSILPLATNTTKFQSFIKQISSELTDENVSHKIDDGRGSIGRKYVRNDEIGIPFAVTIDYDTLEEPHTVTIRECESKAQLRIPLEAVGRVIRDLSNGKLTWQQLGEKYPKFENKHSTE